MQKVKTFTIQWILKLFFILSATLFLVHKSHAQSTYTIKGIITNQSAKPIPQAIIFLLNTNYNTQADLQGGFSIAIKNKGRFVMQVMAPGFASVSYPVIITDAVTITNTTLVAGNRQLSEVVVTAQKQDEDPQKIPLSITTLSAKEIDAYLLQNTKELAGIVPNLYSANSGDNRNVTSIRGISTTSYDPAVATYIDGVNQFSLDTYIAQLFDVERIEVLRGPQGTLYGRNAMGGVINIITKQPNNTINGFLGVDEGNYGTGRYSLGLRAPLVKNKLFLGISGIYTQQDGFYTNLFNNSKFDNQTALTGNYYLKYLPGKDWAITLNIKHNENHNSGAFPLASSITAALNAPYTLNQNAVSRMIDNLFNASLSENYSGSAFNFSSQTTYQSNRRTYQQPIDGDFSPADAVSIVNDYGGNWNKVEVLTQELRLTSPAASDSPINWTTGIYGFYQNNPVKQGTHFGANASLVGSPISNFTSINTNSGSQSGIAFYGQGTYALSKKFDLTLGLRYDYEHQKQSVEGEFQLDGKAATVTQKDTMSSADYHAFSPKFGLGWHLSEANLLYGTYSKGFRTGGIGESSSDPSQPPLYTYEPEYSNNFEIGSKNTFFNNRLRVNVSVFYTHVNNAQVPTLILPDAITITRNVGAMDSKGIEFEMAATILSGLEINNSFGYTHANYTSLLIPVKGKSISEVGNRPVFSPDITSMTAAQYTRAINSNKKITCFIRGEWLYIGDQFFDLANTIEQKPYNLFNANTGVTISKFSITFWMKNINSKKYIDYAYDFGAAHLGTPKTFGISLLNKF